MSILTQTANLQFDIGSSLLWIILRLKNGFKKPIKVELKNFKLNSILNIHKNILQVQYLNFNYTAIKF